MRAYKVVDRGGDPYYSCWVVAENPRQAKKIARDRSCLDKMNGWDDEDMDVGFAPEFEGGEDMTTAHFICDVDTGREPYYGVPYSW